MEVEGIAELSADTNPLSETLVFNVLRDSLSGRREALITAKQQLEEWQTKPDYHLILQRIASDKQRVDHGVRLSAIIQLKNGIDRYWRRGVKQAIADGEKQQIRGGLLHMGVSEDDKQLAKMTAVVAAKIARFDFPVKWYVCDRVREGCL
jgi:hypothetical protein